MWRFLFFVFRFTWHVAGGLTGLGGFLGFIWSALANIFRLRLPADYDEVAVLVRHAGVAGAGVGNLRALEVYFRPERRVRITSNLLDDSRAVQVIEKYFALALASINENLVVHDAAAMRVTCRRHLPYLVTLYPPQILILAQGRVYVDELISSIVPQVKLRYCLHRKQLA